MEINFQKPIRLKFRLTKLLLPVKNIIIYLSRNLEIILDNSLSTPLNPVNQKSCVIFSFVKKKKKKIFFQLCYPGIYLLFWSPLPLSRPPLYFAWITVVAFSYLSPCILNSPFYCPKAFTYSAQVFLRSFLFFFFVQCLTQ